MNTALSLVPMCAGNVQWPVQQRVVIYPDELYRVPASYRQVRVVAGTAYVTQAAQDRVVGAGHEVTLERRGDFALVSPLRSQQVVVELFGDDNNCRPRDSWNVAGQDPGG